ncbi:MAG TPA: hypothetical protein VN954_14395 [Ktedonobacteraceae bacterium]|nr:hypothetical protein [Ktedonobacteraceae bacterium]
MKHEPDARRDWRVWAASNERRWGQQTASVRCWLMEGAESAQENDSGNY